MKRIAIINEKKTENLIGSEFRCWHNIRNAIVKARDLRATLKNSQQQEASSRENINNDAIPKQ